MAAGAKRKKKNKERRPDPCPECGLQSPTGAGRAAHMRSHARENGSTNGQVKRTKNPAWLTKFGKALALLDEVHSELLLEQQRKKEAKTMAVEALHQILS